MSDTDAYKQARRDMTASQIVARGVRDPRVLDAMNRVQRHLFVPERYRREAYADTPLPIGRDQTISQPYIVAFMSELLRLTGDEKVLEIGTGCGYQTAVLSLLAREVHSVEIIPELHRVAQGNLANYTNVHLVQGDGRRGLTNNAPFDRIIVTAAPREMPRALGGQIAPGGLMVIPIGDDVQDLRVVRREQGALVSESILPVRFVPLTGKEIH